MTLNLYYICQDIYEMETTEIDANEISSLSSLQPEDWADIVPQFDFYTKSTFCFPIKVTMNNEIVGIGATIVHNEVAWLAHIIVHPDYRHRGIGQQITQTLVEISKTKNSSTIYLIATEYGEPVYKKVGFIIETDYLIYKNVVKKDWKISGNIQPYKEKNMKQLVALDRDISGEDRIIHLEEHFANGMVYHTEDIVEGYFLPTLGEGLIIASNEIAGVELLKLHLKHNDRVVIPKENNAAQKFLQETGFGEVKVIKRMRLGIERKVQFANIYNRIGGNVG